MTLWRSQLILKHASGLPRDNVSNSFWFNTPGAGIGAAEAEPIAELVRDFVTGGAGAGQTQPLMQYLNNSLSPNGHEVKMTPIDVDTNKDQRGVGFPPVWTEVFDLLGWVPPATGLPNEVACCLSFKNMTSGLVPPAQRRGRVYWGPLAIGAEAAQAGAWRPAPALRSDLIAAGVVLLDDAAALGAPWVVFSRPYAGRDIVPRPGNPRGDLPALPARGGATHLVTDLWVDNAFDTQRKRGERPTLRTVNP